MAAWLILIPLFFSCELVSSTTIELLECEPPDYPQWGGYGPRQDFYIPGDTIHYYCDTDTFIGGNFYRRCEDNGDWSGDAPVCDTPTTFSTTTQTSTADPEDENSADLAVDGLRSTCTSTTGNQDDAWEGTLAVPGQMFRVMVFMPTGDAAYEVILVKENGQEVSCGKKVTRIERYEWEFHNCPEPHNTGAVKLKIKSLSAVPLQICEIAAFVLTVPTCVDPHLKVENGRFQISRKVASLVCDAGYTRSPASRVDCVRNGVWTRKTLYCLERQWEVGNRDPEAEAAENEPQNSDRERNTAP